MIINICEECTTGFEPSRRTQRFCSIRCGNKQRDRRRRAGKNPTRLVESGAEVADVKNELAALKRQLATKTRICQRRLEIFQSKLRSQSCEIDRLEAEKSELRQSNNVLQAEVVQLKRAQRTNVQDLAHIAAWLVSLSNAKGVALDSRTLNILDRRGWNPGKRRSGVSRL